MCGMLELDPVEDAIAVAPTPGCLSLLFGIVFQADSHGLACPSSSSLHAAQYLGMFRTFRYALRQASRSK